jgi:uncharacterized protein (DUF433 family)
MALALTSQPVPLTLTDDGVIRVSGTRVSLDTIVAAFERGSSAEEIALQYSSLPLADIYAVLSFYLRHRQQVQKYLQERAEIAAAVRRDNERLHPSEGIRERLLQRQTSER